MARNNENPGSRGDATGADDCHSVSLDFSIINLDGFHSNCSFSFIRGGAVRSIKGRDAWPLRDLIGAGARGCTPTQSPAPRWSAYIHKSHQEHGLPVETLHEAHGGAFKGGHGHHVLRARTRHAEGKS